MKDIFLERIRHWRPSNASGSHAAAREEMRCFQPLQNIRSVAVNVEDPFVLQGISCQANGANIDVREASDFWTPSLYQ